MANGLQTNGARLLNQNVGVQKFSYIISNIGIIETLSNRLVSGTGRYIFVNGVNYIPLKDIVAIQDTCALFTDETKETVYASILAW